MEITESVIANVLDKSLDEIKALKETNPQAYEILKFGVMCHQLSLSEEDLKRLAKEIKSMKETQN